ncbi:uncharacterized protein At4g15545-like isoform X2 [Punica granatum]|uniref:Uncharacterized protein At4g15545-like isoform X2 n=1 Tax=Punica granatum TaxID=22663 RepID=A0A6P8CIE8_PUNGR|nr:uncharacterized protein At4g15545-like isoform X2 [Punica granatum]
MSSSGSNGGGGPDFDLPEEILSVIPTDPYDQLDLARKITSMAIASRVSKLESDASRFRQKLYEKDRLVFELEEKVLRLERAHQDADSRLKAALDENMRLSQERDSLSMTVKKLSRDLAKLETFKRQLMQSLNEDNSSHAETIDIGTCDQSNPKLYLENDSRHAVQKFSITPYITPRLTPTGTPKIISTAGSPRRYSSAGSPQRTSGAASPIKSGGNVMSSWYSSSQQSSAANSPPRGRSLPGRTPRIDGKEFFRQARTRLSYEQFSAFLANIKELNAQKQTREETLRKAEEIFGTENKDLYLSFQGLLNRNVH